MSDTRTPTKVIDFMGEEDFADLLNTASKATLEMHDIQRMSIISEKFRVHRGRAFITKNQIDWLTMFANRIAKTRPVTWQNGAARAERPMYAPPKPSELEEAAEKFITATAQFVYAVVRAVS